MSELYPAIAALTSLVIVFVALTLIRIWRKIVAKEKTKSFMEGFEKGSKMSLLEKIKRDYTTKK